MKIDDLCREALALAERDETRVQVWQQRLYARAAAEQWLVDEHIDWSAMNLAGLPERIRRAMRRVYAQVHSGEVLALAMTARAIDAAPGLWAKMFGATQLVDEARHVEFFSRVLARLGDPEGPSEAMSALVDELGELRTVDEIVLGTQVILEGYAQRLFLEGRRVGGHAARQRIRLPEAFDPSPLLTAISDLVGRDESRHIAFGVLYLKDRWPALPANCRSSLQDKAYRWSGMLEGVLRGSAPELRYLGIDTADLLECVRQAQLRQFRSIGFDT